jgi:hypothetical protein
MGYVGLSAKNDIRINATSDLELTSDNTTIKFGADDDVTITHDPDDGLIFKSIATADDNPFLLTIQTGETDLAANDVIGKIQFQAPDEGTGTDAILVSAAIQAVAEGDFSSSSNATSLQFMTGSSEAAATKMTLSSAGTLDVTGDITGSTLNADGDTAAGDNAAIGYTSAEGLILTGQGSTNDVTIKNDADADVLVIPTGTTNVSFAGPIAVGQNSFSGGGVIADFHTSGSGVGTQLSFANDHNTSAFQLGLAGNTSGDVIFYNNANTDMDFYTNNALRFSITNSEVVVNDSSADVDFRVESNGNANMLFVDGGNDHVNIGTSSDLGGVFNVSGATSSQFHSTDRHLMSLVSTEAGASDGPRLILQRDSSSPADNDQLGIIEFYGENDADEAVEYARINASILDASDGTEDGAFAINTRIAGANVNRLYMPPTETVFNENSSDIDFRVEGNNFNDVLYVDSGTDTVGIRTTTVSSTAALSVHGDGSANYGGMVIRLTDNTNTNNGGVAIMGATKADPTVPWTGVGFWDQGTVRQMSYGGGGWGYEEATTHVFYTGSYGAGSLGAVNRLAIGSTGRVSLGTTSPVSPGTHNSRLSVEGTDYHSSTVGIAANSADSNGAYLFFSKSRGTSVGATTVVQDDDTIGGIYFTPADGINLAHSCAYILCQIDGSPGNDDVPGRLQFATTPNDATSPLERLRIMQDGQFNFTNPHISSGYMGGSSNLPGMSLGDAGWLTLQRNNATALYVGSNVDREVAAFYSAGSQEGGISISGSTCSFNGFSGLHESSGIATSTEVGTVVSTIDELDVYATTQGEGDDKVASPKAGKDRVDHAKVKVSDTVGDKAVYGVVQSFNEQDKVFVASVGIGSIRVTGACERGDLLESNGDGTAKVQSDDIVRSKTIGKVTIGNNTSSVKLVSCVLYCG